MKDVFKDSFHPASPPDSLDQSETTSVKHDQFDGRIYRIRFKHNLVKLSARNEANKIKPRIRVKILPLEKRMKLFEHGSGGRWYWSEEWSAVGRACLWLPSLQDWISSFFSGSFEVCLKWACVIMNCPSCIVVVVVICGLHSWLRVRLYYTNANAKGRGTLASRWLHKESNLMFTFRRDKDKSKQLAFPFPFAQCKWTLRVVKIVIFHINLD